MPINIPDSLPACAVLESENIFVMTACRALQQHIRPLEIGILNLMPTKITTETQLLRCLSNTPLQIQIDLIQTRTYSSKHTPKDHLLAFYKTFDEIKDKKYDGFIITGAPVELMNFDDIEYWDELCEIMEWTKTNVHSTYHICWGALAGLYYHYGIPNYPLPEKISGVFEHRLVVKNDNLFRGFDDVFHVPHSRHSAVRLEDVEANEDLRVMAVSDEAGLYVAGDQYGHQFFVMGHSEYDAQTLGDEYYRDLTKKMNPIVPKHYFVDDDPAKEPIVNWRSHAQLIYTNWLNYYVYQSTPYEQTTENKK